METELINSPVHSDWTDSDHSGVQHIQRQKDGSKEILHYSKRSNCNTKKTFIINYEYLSLEIFCLNNSRLNSSLLLFFR